MEPPTISLIQEDSRGASWSIKFADNRELVLIYTRQGMYRGGHSHDRPETSLLVKGGPVRYLKRYLDGHEEEFEHVEGQELHNAPGEVHRMFALSENWILDSKINTKIGECITTNDPELRAKVDEQMKELQK